jgi:hypothetical protein
MKLGMSVEVVQRFLSVIVEMTQASQIDALGRETRALSAQEESSLLRMLSELDSRATLYATTLDILGACRGKITVLEQALVDGVKQQNSLADPVVLQKWNAAIAATERWQNVDYGSAEFTNTQTIYRKIVHGKPLMQLDLARLAIGYRVTRQRLLEVAELNDRYLDLLRCLSGSNAPLDLVPEHDRDKERVYKDNASLAQILIENKTVSDKLSINKGSASLWAYYHRGVFCAYSLRNLKVRKVLGDYELAAQAIEGLLGLGPTIPIDSVVNDILAQRNDMDEPDVEGPSLEQLRLVDLVDRAAKNDVEDRIRILAYLTDEDGKLRTLAIRGLESLRPPWEATLDERRQLAGRLSRLEPERRRSLLNELLRLIPDLTGDLISYLGNELEDGYKRQFERLAPEDPPPFDRAVEALGDLGPDANAMVPLLLKYFDIDEQRIVKSLDRIEPNWRIRSDSQKTMFDDATRIVDKMKPYDPQMFYSPDSETYRTEDRVKKLEILRDIGPFARDADPYFTTKLRNKIVNKVTPDLKDRSPRIREAARRALAVIAPSASNSL